MFEFESYKRDLGEPPEIALDAGFIEGKFPDPGRPLVISTAEAKRLLHQDGSVRVRETLLGVGRTQWAAIANEALLFGELLLLRPNLVQNLAHQEPPITMPSSNGRFYARRDVLYKTSPQVAFWRSGKQRSDRDF